VELEAKDVIATLILLGYLILCITDRDSSQFVAIVYCTVGYYFGTKRKIKN